MTTTAAVRFFNFPIQNSSKITVLPTKVNFIFLIQRKVILMYLKHNQIFKDKPCLSASQLSHKKLTLATLRKRAFLKLEWCNCIQLDNEGLD